MTMVRGRVGETQLTVESAHQWLSFLVIHQNNCGVLNTFPLDYPQGQLRQNLDIIRVHQQRTTKGSKAESLGRHGLHRGGWGYGSSGKSTIHASMLTQVQSLTSHIKLDKLPCLCNLRIPAGRWQQSPEAGGLLVWNMQQNSRHRGILPQQVAIETCSRKLSSDHHTDSAAEPHSLTHTQIAKKPNLQ